MTSLTLVESVEAGESSGLGLPGRRPKKWQSNASNAGSLCLVATAASVSTSMGCTSGDDFEDASGDADGEVPSRSGMSAKASKSSCVGASSPATMEGCRMPRIDCVVAGALPEGLSLEGERVEKEGAGDVCEELPARAAAAWRNGMSSREG